MPLVTSMGINDKKYCIKKEEPRIKMTICSIHFVKASLPLGERKFQVLAPLKEKNFWPVFELFLGSLKSVSAFLNTHQLVRFYCVT